MGYDGKGQLMIGPETDSKQAWATLGAELAILEAYVDYRCEISVVVIRTESGAIANYPPVENQHLNHILDTTIAPAPDFGRSRHAGRSDRPAYRREARRRRRAGGRDVRDPGRPHPGQRAGARRPHNSGHWTIDACYASQFEQLVRAICGLPLGSTDNHADAIMKNIIGPDVERWRDFLADPMTKLHLYGKRDAPVGRKMGHATRLLPRR